MKLAQHRNLFLSITTRVIFGSISRNVFLRHSSCLIASKQVVDSKKNMDTGWREDNREIRLQSDVCQTKVSLLTNKRVSLLCG